MTRFLKLCALCTAGVAQASGFYFTDNGSKAMVQGGAFAAQADDTTAMHQNPAGLAQQPGFSFLVDLQLLRHEVSFSRQDPGFDPANPSTVVNTVHNSLGPDLLSKDPYFFSLPFFGVSYGFPLAGSTFTVAAGLFAPPSQGNYNYPVPNYTKDSAGKYVERPNKYAPQRYALTSTNIVIAYPTLSFAWDLPSAVMRTLHLPGSLMIGWSAQLTVSQFKQTQTMYGGDALGDNPQKQLLENPDYDATVAIDLPGQVGFTSIFGLLYKPTEWLSFGTSLRPRIPFKARGKITVDLPEFFNNAGATVVGANGGSCATAAQQTVTNCEANLAMTMPLEFKFGARVMPLEGLGINLDFVYQGWDSVDQLLLTPDQVSLTSGPAAPSTSIAAFGVKKSWQPTWSLRLGGAYRIFKYLSVHAGAMYETGAAPSSTYSVDWTHPSRFIFTGGLTGHLGPLDLIAGAFFTPTNTTVITDSVVARGQTNPDIAAGLVGDGIYTSGGFGLIFGLRGNFGGTKPAAAPLQPAPAPPVEPAAAPQ